MIETDEEIEKRYSEEDAGDKVGKVRNITNEKEKSNPQAHNVEKSRAGIYSGDDTENDLEQEKKDRKRKVWDEIIKVARESAEGERGHISADVPKAMYSAVLASGLFLANGAMSLKRKSLARESEKFLEKRPDEWADEMNMRGVWDYLSRVAENTEDTEKMEKFVKEYGDYCSPLYCYNHSKRIF